MRESYPTHQLLTDPPVGLWPSGKSCIGGENYKCDPLGLGSNGETRSNRGDSTSCDERFALSKDLAKLIGEENLIYPRMGTAR